MDVLSEKDECRGGEDERECKHESGKQIQAGRELLPDEVSRETTRNGEQGEPAKVRER